MNCLQMTSAAMMVAFLTVSCSRNDPASSSRPLENSEQPHVVEPRYASNELLVKFKPGVTSAKAAGGIRAKSGVTTRPFMIAAKSASRGAASPIERWQHVTLPRGTDVKTALREYQQDPDVEYVEPNYRFSVNARPNDPSFSLQWALQNTGDEGGVPGADVGATSAWDVQTGSPSVIVAVIDTGVDGSHPDLAGNLWSNAGEIPANGIDDDSNGYIDDVNGYDFADRDGTPDDLHGHGTHVAGIVAAAGNNSTGVAGVAWRAQIMSLKFMGAGGSGDTSDAIDAILYAASKGARILNNSWGGYIYSQALRDAIASADDAGILFVAAAGNNNNNNDVTPMYPASYDLATVISVAATTRFDAKAGFSNYGQATVDIGAPGEEIYGLAPGGQYTYRSGTSMAAPHVAGAAALLLSHFPTLSASQLKAMLLDRSDQTPAMHGITLTGARLNVHSALDCDPSEVLMGVRAPADGFTVLGGELTTVYAQLNRCGRAVTGAQVLASFTSGEAPLDLRDDGQHGDGAADDGIYANYWVPQVIGAVTLTVDAGSTGGQSLSRSLTGQVRQRVRYQHQSVAYNWIDATSGTPYTLSDDGSVTIPIGFDFDFYGLPRNSVTVNANGLLSFGSSVSTSDNSRMPDPAQPNDLIAPFWDDLDPSTGTIYTLVDGAAPTRRLTVAWINVSRTGASGTVSFQATLYEGSNDILFNYQDVVFGDGRYDLGAYAVTGVEDPDGLDATAYSQWQRLLTNSSARRFYVVPAEPELTYRVTVHTDPVRAASGKLVLSMVDGDGVNNNYFNVLQFASDGDVILNSELTGDTAGSFISGPAYLGDASFANLISQPVIFGTEIRFLMRVSRTGMFEPQPDSFALYLLDGADQTYPTTDPLGTDSLFAIDIDRPQPVPQIFQSNYVSVTVETVGAPVAQASGPYAGAAGQAISFDGTASYDPESDPLTYAWDFGDGATGTGATASHVYAAAGQYTATLVVSDGALYSAPATAQVTIGNGQPPSANAGSDQAVDQQIQVSLDGTGSSDSDGTIQSYSWRQTAGPAVTLTGANSATATFTSPLVSATTTLSFELTVRDNSGDTGRDTVNVTVRKNNLPPVSRAGADQSVNEGTQVTLDGTSSSDQDGTVGGYSWQQIAGPGVALTAPVPGMLSFSAPSVAVDTVLTFQLTVTDNQGATGVDTVDVLVRNTNDPVANAGPDQTVYERTSVVLGGSATDPDGTVASYSWTQLSGITVSLSGANTASASFTAPSVSSDRVLTFRLTVTDNNGLTGTDTVAITVRNLVVPPIANAGPDQTVNQTTTVSLTGVGSSDSDGSIAGYAWIQTAGPTVALSGATSVSASFVAPTVAADTVLTFQLTVTDNDGATSVDFVNVTVRKTNIAPVAKAGSDQSVNERVVVTLNGSGSYDPDGGTLTYQWSQTFGPSVVLSDTAAVQPQFTAPSVLSTATLRFQLRVTDSNGGAASSDTVDIIVTNVDVAPVANAGPDQTVFDGVTVTLTGTATDADGTVTQYQWTQLSGPLVSISGASGASASFVAPDVSGTSVLEFQLDVTDNTDLTGSDMVSVVVQDPDVDGDADGLADGWEYQYFGGATSQSGAGDPDGDGITNLQEFQSGSNPTVADGAPGAVSSVSAKAGDTDVIVAFGKSAAATRYDLYWSTSPSVSKTTGTKITGVTSPYVHSGRANGTTYYYVVAAANLHGESAASSVVSAKPGLRTWGATPLSAGAVSGGTVTYDFARDAAGNAIIAYYVGSGYLPPKLYSLRYNAASGWEQPVLIASLPYYQNTNYTDLKVSMNARGEAVVIWSQDDDTRMNLWSRYMPAGSSTWQTPELVETYDGGYYEQGDIESTDISIGENGLMVAAWTQDEARFFPDNNGYVTDTVYISVRKASQSWSPRREVEMAGVGFSDNVAVSADGSDGALVVWTREICPPTTCSGREYAVLGTRCTAGAWQGPTKLFSNGTTAINAPQIGTDFAGNGVVVYSGVDSRGRYDVKASRFKIVSGWDAAPTTIDSATAAVSSLNLVVKRDGRAVVAWTQSTSMYANLLSSAGTWSGAKALSKVNTLLGLVSDSLGRGMAMWLQAVGKTGTALYSGAVSSAGWGTKTIVNPNVPGLRIAGDEYGDAMTVWLNVDQFMSNTYVVR